MKPLLSGLAGLWRHAGRSDFSLHSPTREDIDNILLEGIYLLKPPAFQNYYDLSFWIDCSFETALERAMARSQEGLPPEATINAYRTIYFPAQEIHYVRDNPRAATNAIIKNDPRLPA